MKPQYPPVNLTSSGIGSTYFSQAVHPPAQSSSRLPQEEFPAGPPPALTSQERVRMGKTSDNIELPTGNNWLSMVINRLQQVTLQIEAASAAGVELPSPNQQNRDSLEDIARIADTPLVRALPPRINTVQRPSFIDHASTEIDHESGRSASREDCDPSTGLTTPHDDPDTGLITPPDDALAGPYNENAQIFAAAAADAGIKLGPMPDPGACSKTLPPAPKPQLPTAGPSTSLNPAAASASPAPRRMGNFDQTSPAFSPGSRLNPGSEEFVPSGAPSSDHPVSDSAGQGLNPATAVFQPGVQQLDAATAAFWTGWQATVQGGAHPEPNGQASGAQVGVGTGGNHPGFWLDPQALSFDGYEASNGAGTVAQPAPQPSYHSTTPELPPDPPLIAFEYPGEVPPGWEFAVMVNLDGSAEYVMFEDPDWEPEDGDGGENSCSSDAPGPSSSQGSSGTTSSSSHRPGFSATGQLESDHRPPDGPRSSLAYSAGAEPGSSNGGGSDGTNGDGGSKPGPSRKGPPLPSFPLEGKLPVVSQPQPAIPESIYKTGELPLRESRFCSNCGHRMACIHPGSRCTRCKRGRYR